VLPEIPPFIGLRVPSNRHTPGMRIGSKGTVQSQKQFITAGTADSPSSKSINRIELAKENLQSEFMTRNIPRRASSPRPVLYWL
jgi:hypothetical protein